MTTTKVDFSSVGWRSVEWTNLVTLYKVLGGGWEIEADAGATPQDGAATTPTRRSRS